MAKLVKIDDSWVNPELVELIIPEPPKTIEGIVLQAGRDNHCVIVMTSGSKILSDKAPDQIFELLFPE